jgi:hypothetical protein
MTTISSSRRSSSYATSSSSNTNRQPPAGAVELEQKLRTAGLSDDQVKSTMKKLYGERGGNGGGTLDGTEGAGTQAFALKLQSALMSAGVSNTDAQSVVSSVGSGTSASSASSSSAASSSTDSFDGSSTTARSAPAGAQELEEKLRTAGMSDEQVKSTMKKLFGERGGNGGGTLDGTEGAGTQAFALKLQSALMSAGLSNDDAQGVVSGSARTTSRWGYSGVSSFE